MGGLRVSTRLIAFAKIAILARILVPEQFGLFGIASLVLAFLEVFSETGINIFLIQERADIKRYLNTAWIVSIVRGTLISLILLAAAPYIASFFNSPDAYSLLLLISVVPFIRGFINPAIVKFQKELQFNKEFLLRFSIFTFNTLVTVGVALVTRSAASLVWGLIAGALLEVILSHTVIKPAPKFAFDAKKAKKVVRRGKWITLSGIFSYLFREGDDIVVGRLLNTTSLGLYQIAYKVSSLPITEIADVVIKVTFPIYVKISGDAKRLKEAFIKSLLGVAVLVLPFGIILFTFAEQIVLVLLGNNWIGAIPVIKVLAAFGVIRAITAVSYPLFLSLKKQEYVTAITLVGILGLATTIIPLVRQYGIVGAGISALIGASVATPVAVFYVFRVFSRLK